MCFHLYWFVLSKFVLSITSLKKKPSVKETLLSPKIL